MLKLIQKQSKMAANSKSHVSSQTPYKPYPRVLDGIQCDEVNRKIIDYISPTLSKNAIHYICISYFMQTTFFYLERFLKKSAND